MHLIEDPTFEGIQVPLGQSLKKSNMHDQRKQNLQEQLKGIGKKRGVWENITELFSFIKGFISHSLHPVWLNKM